MKYLLYLHSRLCECRGKPRKLPPWGMSGRGRTPAMPVFPGSHSLWGQAWQGELLGSDGITHVFKVHIDNLKKSGGIFTLRSVCRWHMVYISPFISNPDTTISQFIQHLRGPQGAGIKVSQKRINPDKTEVMMIVGRKYLKNVARVLLCFSYEHIFLLLPRLLLASQLISADVYNRTSLTQAGQLLS